MTLLQAAWLGFVGGMCWVVLLSWLMEKGGAEDIAYRVRWLVRRRVARKAA